MNHKYFTNQDDLQEMLWMVDQGHSGKAISIRFNILVANIINKASAYGFRVKKYRTARMILSDKILGIAPIRYYRIDLTPKSVVMRQPRNKLNYKEEPRNKGKMYIDYLRDGR